MADSLRFALSTVALPAFIAGALFGQCCDVQAVLETVGPIFIMLLLTISNILLLQNFMRSGQKPLVQSFTTKSSFQSFDASVIVPSSPKVDYPMDNKDVLTQDNALPSNEVPNEVLDLSGTYKLESKVNFEEFLASQGVGWAIRKAADKAVPTNVIKHNLQDHILTIRVEGIISSQTTYQINGDPLETRIQSRVFSDTMKYLESGDGIQVTKVCKAEGYHIFVKRQLSLSKQVMTVTSTAIWPDRQVETQQIYRKIED